MEWIVQILGPLVLGALAWPFVQWRRSESRREAAAMARAGQRTSGLVMEVWRDGDGWNVTYEFSPGEGKAAVRRTETFEEVVEQPARVGEHIELAYESSSPYYSRIVRADRDKSGGHLGQDPASL